MKAAMLTTIDNPFDPFTQFDEWRAYDEQKGYNTCSYLARVCTPIRSLGPEVYKEQINQAIDEVLANDFLKIYKKVLSKE